MYKPKLIHADPKVKVHGEYSAGSPYINRARNSLSGHLLEDYALNINVSKRRHIIAPGVVCFTTHEFSQTYIDIYTEVSVSSRRSSIKQIPAYFGQYYTGIVTPHLPGYPYHSFCSYNAYGTVLKYSSIYFIPDVSMLSWDYLGNNQVGAYGVFVDDPSIDIAPLLPGRVNNLITIDVGTLGINSQRSLGIGVSGFPFSTLAGADGRVLKLENTNVLIQQYVGEDAQYNPLFSSYIFNFATGSVTASGAPPGVGSGGMTIGGLLNSKGQRVVAFLNGQYSPTENLYTLAPDQNGGISSYSVAANVAAYSTEFTGSYWAAYTGGFDSNNNFIVVFYNSQATDSTGSYPSPNPASLGLIPTYIRVIWKGGIYDYDAPGLALNYYAAWYVAVKPFGEGALIITDAAIIYFANGTFLAYALLTIASAPMAPIAQGGVGADYYPFGKKATEFNNTNMRGVFNLFDNNTAGVSNTTVTTNIQTMFPTEVGLDGGYRWVPVLPGDWLSYPGIYG